MKLLFSDLINRHKNQPALIAGHGPTLNPFMDKLLPYKQKGILLFGCNEWFNIYNAIPRYWCMSSNVDIIKKYSNVVNKCNGDLEVVYSDSIDLEDHSHYNTLVNKNYYTFDQRHFGGKRCEACERYKCYKYLDPSRKTIQEQLQDLSGNKQHYGTGSSIFLHMLSLTILMGCNPIYFTGFDISYKKSESGYCKTKQAYQSDKLIDKNALTDLHDEIINDVMVILESAKLLNRKVLSLHPECCHDLFELGEINV